jgi:hypothetical protein
MPTVKSIRPGRKHGIGILSLEIVYTRKRQSIPLVFGKLVKIQHSPATVSAESLSNKPLFRRWSGKAEGFEDAQVRRPASAAQIHTALEGGAQNAC